MGQRRSLGNAAAGASVGCLGSRWLAGVTGTSPWLRSRFALGEFGGERAQRLDSHGQPVLDSQAVAHSAKGTIVGHKHVIAGEHVRFDVPAIFIAGTRTLMCLP